MLQGMFLERTLKRDYLANAITMYFINKGDGYMGFIDCLKEHSISFEYIEEIVNVKFVKEDKWIFLIRS